MKKLLCLIAICGCITLSTTGCGTDEPNVVPMDKDYWSHDPNSSEPGIYTCWIEKGDYTLEQGSMYQLCQDYLDGQISLVDPNQADPSQKYLIVAEATLSDIDISDEVRTELSHDNLGLSIELCTGLNRSNFSNRYISESIEGSLHSHLRTTSLFRPAKELLARRTA